MATTWCARSNGARGAEMFWRIALRPGKPLSVGVRDRTLVFGVPGNPVSVLVCFELFVRPALAALQGRARPPSGLHARDARKPGGAEPRARRLIRVRHTGDTQVEPLTGQQSHQLAITALAEGLARIPAGTGAIARGQQVDYLPLGVR